MEIIRKKVSIDTSKIILSSDCLIKKTESFLVHTKFLIDVDFFILKIAEHLLKEFDNIFGNRDLNTFSDNSTVFKVETEDGAFSFLIKFGFQLKNENKKNIIFYKFLNRNQEIRQNDARIKLYLNNNKTFDVYISETKDFELTENFQKLYRISNQYGINFPILSKEQLELVTTEDQNVIIQGVAGSGKTNVCIEKLVWCASKNYGGKILYTTFSRGLLTDTKLKIEAFKESLKNFYNQYQSNNVCFLDGEHKKAIENHLGIFFFVDEDNIAKKLKNMIEFFENKIDYFLIEDLYRKNFEDKIFANEQYFIKNYIKNTKNHNIFAKFSKLKNLSQEMIYKEIFGLIFGYESKNQEHLTLQEYENFRKNDFEKFECEAIFQIAMDYKNHLLSNNLIDNNFACKEMLKNKQKIERYSLVVADEVQDFSQITLKPFKEISLKMFCAGDALQMINPSYFSFGYLKNLLFENDIVSVAELKNNYRNTKKIQTIIDDLEKINIQKFGVHNFITTGQGIENNVETLVTYCCSENFLTEISKMKYDNFTIVVNSQEQKLNLRKYLKNQEILTISEIKGLERDTILLFDLLSDNIQKWNRLEILTPNRKTADENSIYRYYFNVFYVGISRAKQNLFVVESKNVKLFSQFFNQNFVCQSTNAMINSLSKIISQVEFTQDEYLERVDQFIKLEQFDNARFNADKLSDDVLRTNQLAKIDIYQKFVHNGQYREAGIAFWQNGMLEEAKKQFVLSNDAVLVDFVDATSKNEQKKLSFDIVKYFCDVKNNKIATEFILDTIKNDINNLKSMQKEINEKYKKIRGTKNGK